MPLTSCVSGAADPPVIVEMNSSVEAIEGSHVSLLCGADSNPPPLLTWMRDGTVLREAVTESLSLELDEVTPAEDGVYACLAENAYGQDNRTVGLSVMCESPPPPGAELGAQWGAVWTMPAVEMEMERKLQVKEFLHFSHEYLVSTYSAPLSSLGQDGKRQRQSLPPRKAC